MTESYIEYNLINNIPILYPLSNKVNFLYCPRYTIANSEHILKCSEAQNNIMIYNNRYKYIKIDIQQTFRTLDNNVMSVFCFVVIDSSIEYNIDFSCTSNVFEWILNQENHYILVTTPVLKYKNVYYNVANDNKMSIIRHTLSEIQDDIKLVNKLVKTNCYTICDNNNILISLYHNKYLTKKEFVEIFLQYKQRNIFYFTQSKWFELINQHRILNACDFPIVSLFAKPNLIDKNIYDLFDNTLFPNNNVYVQSFFKDNILFSTPISNLHPYINSNVLNIIMKNNIENNFFISNHYGLGKYFDDPNVHIKFDFYGIFSSIVSCKSIWLLWKSNDQKILKSISDIYCDGENSIIFDLLCPIFYIYNKGVEGKTVKRSRVRYLWKKLIQYFDKEYDVVFEHLIAVSDKINIPYMFLCDMFFLRKIDFKCKYRIISQNDHILYHKTTLYDILQSHKHRNNVYYFHKNVLKKRILDIFVLLYKRFGLFENDISSNYYHVVGEIIISYLENNKDYLF